MEYYPINLNIRNKNCLVVGAGTVGTRKVQGLLNCGANVTVISPKATDKIISLANAGLIELKKRDYLSSDLKNYLLVIGATDNESLNRQISGDAMTLNKLCNIADRPKICNFILPAVVRQGDLVISISTSGKSPALAKKLRKRFEKKFGVEYGTFLNLMGNIRNKLLKKAHQPEVHKRKFESLIDRGLIELIKNDQEEQINALLSDILGEGYQYKDLMKKMNND